MNFKNQSLAIFNKGHFEPINRELLTFIKNSRRIQKIG